MPRTTRRAAAGSLLAAATLALYAAQAGAAQLKGVQTNTSVLPLATLSVTAALSPAVDTTKSFLVFGTSATANEPRCGQVSGQITNATTITFTRADTTACPAVTIKWYVAEFASGVSVQRGTYDWQGAGYPLPANIPLAPSVNLTRSFPVISYRLNGATFDNNDFLRAKLTAGNNLQINVFAVAPVSPQIVEWQVIEYTGATVQTGDIAFAAADFAKTAVAPGNFAAVVPGRSWLVYSYDANVGLSGFELDPGKELVRGVITNGSTLTFDRTHNGGGTTINLTWYLIEFTDGTSVQQQSEPFTAIETQRDVTLTAVSTANSIAVAGGDFQRGGRTGYGSQVSGGDDNVGVSWFTLDLTSSTNLRIKRGAADPGVTACAPACPATADVGWFVVSFNAGCCSLSTTEVPGSTITVTGTGQFDMRFNTANGGGLDVFHDLALDPTGTIDLVGSKAGLHIHESLLINEVYITGVDWFTPERVAPALQKLDLLEATSTRVRLRAEAFYGQWPVSGIVLAGMKGIGDYSVYPSGRMALRWNRVLTGSVTYDKDDWELVTHYKLGPDPLSFWTRNSSTDNTFPNAGSETFALAQIDQPTVQTDFLLIRSQPWAAANKVDFWASTTDEESQIFWEDNAPPAQPVAAGAWNFLTYFKPTNLGAGASPWLDTAVTTRDTDYRTHPAGEVTINAGKGFQWSDAAENTAAGTDWFNESEAVYPLDLSQTQGLDFTLDGATTKRYAPFFKIRGWRSFIESPTVTLNTGSGAVPLRKDVDYKAAVKPVSRAHYAQQVLWHSTLENAAAVTSPEIGPAGTVGVGTGFTAARYGAGANVTASTHYVALDSGAFIANRGAIEFWFRPSFNNTDGILHDICGFVFNGSNRFVLEKRADNNLYFQILASGADSQLTVTSADYSWRAADWVHIRLEWDDGLPLATQQRLYLNGVEPVHTDPTVDYAGGSLSVATEFRFGNTNGDATFAPGLYDEIYSYDNSVQPVLLASGGLTTNGSEYLADTGRNFTLSFSAVDGLQNGSYFYLGADSKFRGLNVALQTPGAGVAAGALDWEYWNGTAWTNLETVAGFADSTNSFKKTGSVYWTSDPPSWSVYSVNGGPDLYYLRVHLATGAAYTTAPVERVIKTDILLFQYCGDATTAANFVFAVPPTTAVKLQSFSATPGDASVVLDWRTASELDNLGFHLYRGPSEEGPWTRLDASLIPGLGSSATGQAYSFRDTGLVNGTRYFYRLEDVDASSKATSHDPVFAVPMAGAPGGAPGSEPETSAAKKKVASGPSCPDWVVAAYGSMAGASASSAGLTCTRHGDPEAASLGVVSRDSRQATLELKTGGFYALHEASGKVRVFVPGFDFPQDPQAPALPFRRALVDAVVGRRAQLGGVRALDQVSFKGLVPASLGRAEMQVSRDGTVRAGRRALEESSPLHVPLDLARLLPSVFQGEAKSAVVQITPLRFDARRQQIVLSKRVLVKLLFTARETGESGRGSFGRREKPEKPVVGELLARLYTTSRGLYAASFEQLFPDRQRGLAVSQLRLDRQGEAQGFHVAPASDVFGPGSVLYFHADTTASSTDFSSEMAWELLRGAGGARMPLVAAAPSGGAVSSASTVQASFETNRFYQPGLLEAPDLWLWEALGSGTTRTESFSLSAVDATSSQAAEIDVFLQGASESGNPVDHHVSVSVNGVPAGEAQFAGKKPYRMSLSVAASLLHEGANELQLTNVADTGVSSFVFLDRFTIAHPQLSSLAGGRFDGTWPESGSVRVSVPGGVSAPVVVVDVTGESASGSGMSAGAGAVTRWLTGLENTAGALRFRAETGHRYLAVSQSALLGPRVSSPAPSSLRSTQNQADYLLIAPRAFLGAAEPLLQRRHDQGLAARAVAFEEIADEFGHGQPSAEAIKGFLAYAFQSWARPSPRYVLLLGDSTYDPRNFTGTSQPSPLPALWTKTSYLWTASDPQLAAVNGEDALPDLAIGRLPATTVEQAQKLVEKLIAWEDSGQGLSGAAVLVADNPDLAGDFEANARDIAQSFLPGRSQLLLLSELGAGTRPAIQDAMNSGLSLLSYVGHGGAAVWASENVWNSWDAASLLAQSRQPFLLTMNCLNGYFVAPSFDSLSESLLKAEGRGAIAAFSPSGLSLDGPAHQYHRALMAELTNGRNQRLGDAVLAAQKAYAQTGLMPELLSVYHLLGDPGMRIQ